MKKQYHGGASLPLNLVKVPHAPDRAGYASPEVHDRVAWGFDCGQLWEAWQRKAAEYKLKGFCFFCHPVAMGMFGDVAGPEPTVEIQALPNGRNGCLACLVLGGFASGVGACWLEVTDKRITETLKRPRNSAKTKARPAVSLSALARRLHALYEPQSVDELFDALRRGHREGTVDDLLHGFDGCTRATKQGGHYRGVIRLSNGTSREAASLRKAWRRIVGT